MYHCINANVGIICVCCQMCLAVTPLLPFLPLLTGGLIPPPGGVSAPQSLPQQGQQSQQNQQNDQNEQNDQNDQDNQDDQNEQNQQSVEIPDDIQSIEQFVDKFPRSYSSLAEQTFRQGVFSQNLAIINVSFTDPRSNVYLLLFSLFSNTMLSKWWRSMILNEMPNSNCWRLLIFLQGCQYFQFRLTTPCSLLGSRLTS